MAKSKLICVKKTKPISILGWPNAQVGDEVKVERTTAAYLIGIAAAEDHRGELKKCEQSDVVPEKPSMPRNLQFIFQAQISGNRLLCPHVARDKRLSDPEKGEVALEVCRNCADGIRMAAGRTYKCRKISPIIIRSAPNSDVGSIVHLSPNDTLSLLRCGAVKLCRSEEAFAPAELELAPSRDMWDD